MLRLNKKNALMLITASIILSFTLASIRLYINPQKQRVQTQKTVKEHILEETDKLSNINKDRKVSPYDLPTKREQFSNSQKQIYDYMESIWDNYENLYPDDKAESLVLIEASQKFEKGIVEIFKAYMLVQNEKSGSNLSENEIDVLAMQRLNTLGFKKGNGKWYYNGMVVQVGSPLPIPESMKLQRTEQRQEVIVKLEVTTTISELRHAKFTGKTNLPNDMKLILRVENSEKGYMAQDDVTVKNGQFMTDWFYDAHRPGNRLADGKYTLVITSPTVKLQPSSVRAILGELGKSMKGHYIKFDPIWGNRVEFEIEFYVP